MILIVAVTAVQRDGHGGLKNGGNSHRSRERIMQWSTRQYQSIFRRWSQKGDNWRRGNSDEITNRTEISYAKCNCVRNKMDMTD